VLFNPTNPANVLAQTALDQAAADAGIKLQFIAAHDAAELESAFAAAVRAAPGGILCIWDHFLEVHATRIAGFAVQHRLPFMAPVQEFVRSGALLSYGPKIPDQWRTAARFVDRILQGRKPADLPVELPLAFELTVNRKTAQALGLTIPPELLLLADKVIE
jgi:putative ABC transport system substrate-binding protein